MNMDQDPASVDVDQDPVAPWCGAFGLPPS
jgi:hypothetical protein